MAPTPRPSTFIVGDIGGHLDVLTKILDYLGATDSRLPEDVTVIQVGDIVRATARSRRNNTALIHAVADLIARNEGRWIQLIGNHECPALGGPAPGRWDTDAAFEPDCINLLRHLWDEGHLHLAASLGEGPTATLVTHAGLNPNSWRALGGHDAATTAQALDQLRGKPMHDISRPGVLVTGSTNPTADVMWAEVNFELYNPWLEEPTVPFHQVHGHASPFHYSPGQFWPDTPDNIRHATTVAPQLRRSVMQHPDGHTFTSVDWTLEDYNAPAIWPLYSTTATLTYPLS